MTEGTNVTHEATRLAEEAKRLASDFATIYGRLHFARQCGGPVTRVGEETESARAALHAAIDALAALAQERL
jgi:hypothetical protein